MTYSAPIADRRLRFAHNLMLHCILLGKSTMLAIGVRDLDGARPKIGEKTQKKDN
jgi:hypothetical protein